MDRNTHSEQLAAYFDRWPETAPGSRIAIALTWPQVKNAEYEVVMRMCRAAQNIGAEVIVTDNDGFPLWSSKGDMVEPYRRISKQDADFAIALHFESPKLIDLYTYYTVWQPISFYETFGYEQSMEKILTYDDALSCSSDECDAHIRNLLFDSRGQIQKPLPFLFHSPPQPYLPPRITDKSRPFYVGINWERVSAKRGRFHELLERMDEEELIDIYGPRLLLGVKPWEGFNCYRGEIPFDGKSVVEAVNRSGICLALSSEPHRQSGVMSNRLFEGLAGGAVIIANHHPFIDKYFSDLVYLLTDTDDENAMFFEVQGIVENIRRNPEENNRRALEGQRRLSELFSLERCLSALIAQHPERSGATIRVNSKTPETTIVLPYSGASLSAVEDFVDDLKHQRGIRIKLVVACSAQLKSKLQLSADGSVSSISVVHLQHDRVRPSGRDVASMFEILKGTTTETLSIADVSERYFEQHFATLSEQLVRFPECSFAKAEIIDEVVRFAGQRSTRSLRRLNNANGSDQIEDPADPGCYAFRRNVLDELSANLVSLISGSELACLTALASHKGPMALTGRTTFVSNRSSTGSDPDAHGELKRQFVTDRTRFLPARLQSSRRVQPRIANPDGTDGSILGQSTWLPVGTKAHIRKGSAASAMIARGFSHLEDEGTWIEGTTGELFFSLGGFDKEDASNLELVLNVEGRQSNLTGLDQACYISVNGVQLLYTPVPSKPADIVVSLPLFSDFKRSMRVRIDLQHAEQVTNSAGNVIDPRYIGLFVRSISVQTREASIPPVSVDTTYQLGRKCNGFGLLHAGAIVFDDCIGVSHEPTTLKMSVESGLLATRIKLRTSESMASAETRRAISCEVNGAVLGTFAVDHAVREVYFDLQETLRGNPAFALMKLKSHSEQVDDADTLLPILVESIEIQTTTSVTLGTTYHTKTSGNGLSLLKSGFSYAEDEFVWIDGLAAEIGFVFKPGETGSVIKIDMDVMARRSQQGTEQTLTLFMNDQLVGNSKLPEGRSHVAFKVPRSLFTTDSVSLRLGISHAEPARDKAGVITDSRKLGLALASIQLA